MDALVLSQVRCLTEGLAALGTLIRPLSSVSAQVLEEVRTLHEHFVARPTFERFVPREKTWAGLEGLSQLIPYPGLWNIGVSLRLMPSPTHPTSLLSPMEIRNALESSPRS